MEKDSEFCSDCKAYTEVVLDHRSGDTICTECGLVLEERARSDRLTDNGVLTVNISNDNKKAVSCVLPRLHKTLQNPDKSLHIAFESLGVMADQLALVATIRDHAKELYKKVDNRKFCRGRNCDAIMLPASFLLAKKRVFPEL
ncbi:transcription initiation factor IIB isoform X2 [Prunus yedoensis var. nudiflora]|uniref:Transcription initiation factor IIB isoform X2 n=1 Tax=Prunus yedoensis var. nudiflora TaxID=2094558 RepID=A0A314Z492_PRUYE|nr:transcription initiation factor IIB isoform X2 [Prunus yedoensis var. nudiflora]